MRKKLKVNMGYDADADADDDRQEVNKKKIQRTCTNNYDETYIQPLRKSKYVCTSASARSKTRKRK